MADTVINGSDIFVYMDGIKIAQATSHTLSMKMNTRDTSNKDTGKFNTKAAGRLDVTASCDALVVYTNLSDMLAAYLDRTPVHLHFAEDDGAGSPNEDVFYAEGDFIISGMDVNAADQQNASYSCSFDHYDGFTYSADLALRVGIAKTNCTAPAADDGAAFAIPKGGTAPYTFLWDSDGSPTTQYVTDLEPGTYTVTISDTSHPVVEATASVVITEPAA